MSLQLGHRWVSLKHQKQMGRKKDYKQKLLHVRRQQESISQYLGFTLKRSNHIEALSWGAVKALEGGQS